MELLYSYVSVLGFVSRKVKLLMFFTSRIGRFCCWKFEFDVWYLGTLEKGVFVGGDL